MNSHDGWRSVGHRKPLQCFPPSCINCQHLPSFLFKHYFFQLVLTPGKKRPTGGDGGRGGDVYIVADRGLNGMAFNTFHFNGGNGKNGGSEYIILPI